MWSSVEARVGNVTATLGNRDIRCHTYNQNTFLASPNWTTALKLQGTAMTLNQVKIHKYRKLFHRNRDYWDYHSKSTGDRQWQLCSCLSQVSDVGVQGCLTNRGDTGIWGTSPIGLDGLGTILAPSAGGSASVRSIALEPSGVQRISKVSCQ